MEDMPLETEPSNGEGNAFIHISLIRTEKLVVVEVPQYFKYLYFFLLGSTIGIKKGRGKAKGKDGNGTPILIRRGR